MKCAWSALMTENISYHNAMWIFCPGLELGVIPTLQLLLRTPLHGGNSRRADREAGAAERYGAFRSENSPHRKPYHTEKLLRL
ncbi:unnamed protein product [Allacma fusca]|uniref:Uncharacterized protein n=1 Tax=Allacma fusca TaxID=39272 RepID=A0A8J2K2P7_9HEXA|nr:unnamed protein product [Allacma fusca]